MSKKYIFNSSLPRSGSELMQVILHQNPEIYGSPTSPLLEYWFGARANAELPEVKAQNDDLMHNAFMGFCKGGMDGYYDSITDRPIVCDKSRGWGFYYKWLEEVIGEQPKVICCVRDLREIICSMEKVWQKTRHLPVGPDNPKEMQNLTIDGRTRHWLNTQPVGMAMQRMADAIHQGFHDNMHFVRYEDLTTDPDAEMKKVYEYLELPYFQHDFNNLEKQVEEDSAHFGVYGNHDVRSKIEPSSKKYNEILGKGISDNIVTGNQWYFDKFYN
jgi:sulfotransferase